MIMPSKDKMYNGRKGIGFENPSYFGKAKELRPSLYDERVIGLGYTPIDSPYSATSSLKPYVPTVILEKIIIELEEEVVSLLEKEKENLEIIESLKSKGSESSANAISESENQSEHDCHVVEKDLDTLSSVRRPKHSGVIWKKKGSPNTSNVNFSFVSNSKLNKDVKRYSRKDLLSCNNSHHVDTRSAYACNDAMNVSCNSRWYASCDVNDLFVIDDVSIRKSQASKMPFTKKPRDYLNVHSRSNSNKSLPRTVFRWLTKMQPLAEPVATWIPKICLWIIDLGCSKHMTGNRALLTNFVEKFLGMVRFGNNDFAMIAGYGDVVIGSTTIKKSTCFVQNEDGVDLLSGNRSSNLYTIAVNKIASNASACLLAKASSLQSWLWHQRLSHLNFATINNLVKNNLVRGLPKMKFEKDHLCSACEQGKIHRKHHKSKTAFASNKPLYLLHMDLCGPMRVGKKVSNESDEVLVVLSMIIHGCYLLNDYDDVGKLKEKGDIGVFVGYSKESSAFRSSVRTRGQLANSCLFACLLSSIEPANVVEALKDVDWVSAMQDELDQFARLKFWRLVPRLEGKTIIKTKWIFKNKKDESSLVIQNKARLV
ncbi:integrase, catalytic region, zinc finger, CCHC-type containing protein, partial [Tanacetum coccineum]